MLCVLLDIMEGSNKTDRSLNNSAQLPNYRNRSVVASLFILWSLYKVEKIEEWCW